MAACRPMLSFKLLEIRGSSYFFFGTYCVLSGEGSVLNGKSSLCDFNLQKSSPLKGTRLFVIYLLLHLYEFSHRLNHISLDKALYDQIL